MSSAPSQPSPLVLAGEEGAGASDKPPVSLPTACLPLLSVAPLIGKGVSEKPTPHVALLSSLQPTSSRLWNLSPAPVPVCLPSFPHPLVIAGEEGAG